MAPPNWKQVLKIINLVCQLYFISFSALTMIIGFYVTLPEFAERDPDVLYHLKLLAWFIFLNMGGNYICMVYTAKSSMVKPTDSASRSALLAPPASGNIVIPLFSAHKSETMGSTSSFSHPSGANSSHKVWNQMSSGNSNCKEYSLSVGNSVMVNNNNESSMNNGGFTYNSAYSGDANSRNDYYCSQGIQKRLTSADALLNSSLNPQESIAGWVYCKDCKIFVPQRAKHCPLCKHCVLKRDHHCFFGGACIGFHNQRYFIIFCLYAAMGGIYNTVVIISYLNKYYEPLQTWGYFSYFVPFLLSFWLTGSTSGSIVGMLIFLYWSILTVSACGFYFVKHLFLVYRGQTNYEFVRGIKTYQGTVYKNIRSVFGPCWFIGFVIPAPFLGYHGDGVDWDEFSSDGKIL